MREELYWPGMSKHITEIVNRCKMCQKFADNNKGNPELKQYDIGKSQWNKVGVGL